VLKGKVASFADDQFIVMLDTGSGRNLSRATVYMGDVSRIEFDSSPVSSDATSSAAQLGRVADPTESSPRIINDPPPRETKTRGVPASETPVRSSPPPDSQPKETGPPETQPAPTPVKEPESSQQDKPQAINPPTLTTQPASETSESDRLNRKPLVALKTMTVDVSARKDWTSSGLIVRRGDRIRVTASGTITLDPVTGKTCGPEGISDLADPKKLLPDQPTGALIAVISSDNDDFIFLGRAGEFTAARDGLLFLSVNEGLLSDNIGTFKAVVEVLGARK
jgi:hypothetical protein